MKLDKLKRFFLKFGLWQNPSNNSVSLIKNCIFYFFLFLFSFFLFQKIRHVSIYVLQEWLINYSHGFVRRGLPGTLLLFLKRNFNLSPLRLILLFSVLTITVFSGLYLLKVKKALKVLNYEGLIAVLFLPSLIMFMINNPGMVGRKDFFFLFGLLINLFLIGKIFKSGDEKKEDSLGNGNLEKAINHYCSGLFVWYNLLSIPTAFSHEAILLLGIPLNMVITSNVISLAFTKKQTLVKTVMIYLPTIAISLLCFVFKGNREIALGIFHSWQAYSDVHRIVAQKFEETSSNAISWLGKSINDGVMAASIKNWKDLGNWIFAFFLSTVILIRTSSKVLENSLKQLTYKLNQQQDSIISVSSHSVSEVDLSARFSFQYALIPFLASAVLYVTAIDWGRWFFVVSIGYTFCFLSPELIQIEVIRSQNSLSDVKNSLVLGVLSPIYKAYSSVFKFLHNQSLLQRFSLIYCLILIYTLFILKLDFYSMNRYDLYGSAIFELILKRF